MPSAAEAFQSTLPLVSPVRVYSRDLWVQVDDLTAWCNIQHINPLSASESVVSDFLLHLHTEKQLAISTIAGYQMAIANTIRATSSAKVGLHCTEVATSKYRNGTGTINIIFQSWISP